MKRTIFRILVMAVTALALGLWLFTGRHAYTKYETVEKVPVEVSASDPLAATGFYDDGSSETVVHKASFHFGLFPTPRGVFDKHALSVASVLTPTWSLFLGMWWLNRRRHTHNLQSR